jgi:ribose transport system permease protein
MTEGEPVSDNVTAPEQTTIAHSEPVAAGGGGGRNGRDLAGAFFRKYGVVLMLLGVVALFSVLRPHTFPTINNLKSILDQAAPSMIIAAGLTAVLVMNDFDLSFGSVIGLGSGMVCALIVNDGWSWQIAVIATLLGGVVIGLVNGIGVSYFGAGSFIFTLAIGTVVTGFEYAFTSQETIFSGLPSGFTAIGQGDSILGFGNLVWIAVAVAVVMWAVLDKTELGRYMYAIGGNPEAATLAGVPVKRLRVAGFVIVAVGAAAAGLLISSESASYTVGLGQGYLLPAYAAVFLGTTMLRTGQFNMPGTIIGVLFLGVIQTGLTMLGLEPFVTNLVQGSILAGAVLLSRFLARNQIA